LKKNPHEMMAQENGKKENGNRPKNSSSLPPLSLTERFKLIFSSFKYTTILCCFKFKKQTNISILEFQILKLKENFGVDYLTLVGDNAHVEDLQNCVGTALEQFNKLQDAIIKNMNQIDDKETEINRKMTFKTGERCERVVSSDTSPKVRPQRRKNKKENVENKEKKMSNGTIDCSECDLDDCDGYDTEDSDPRCVPKRRSKTREIKRTICDQNRYSDYE